jgi:ribosomal-protein-alanine N-acetyltransferase
MSPRADGRTSRRLRVEGPSLALRYPAMHDAPALYALASDARVTRYFSWGPYRDEEEPRAWLRSLPGRRASGAALELAIVDASDRPVGIILLCELSARDRRAIVGTWLGRAHWGTGANAEAKALITALAFGPLGLRRLAAYADVRNVRSQEALERLGFSREGVLRDYQRHADRPRTVALYSLLQREWRDSPLAAVPVSIVGTVPRAFLPARG